MVAPFIAKDYHLSKKYQKLQKGFRVIQKLPDLIDISKTIVCIEVKRCFLKTLCNHLRFSQILGFYFKRYQSSLGAF